MARFPLSRPTLRELARITFVLAVLCVVVSGAQYAFVRWQASKADLEGLTADANSVTAALHYTTAPDLAYLNKAYIDSGPYMAINDDGTVINIFPGFRNSSIAAPQFLPRVELPWQVSRDASKVVKYISPLGQKWQLITIPMDDAFGVVGLSEYDEAGDRENLLLSNAKVFPKKIADFTKADEDKIDSQVSWALVDKDGKLLAADGEIPFHVDPIAVGFSANQSGYREGPSGIPFYVLYSTIKDSRDRPAALIIGYEDVSQERTTLDSMLWFSIGVAALSFLAFLTLFVASLFHHETEKRYIRESFQKYFSPQILEAILNDPDRLKDQRTEISVMFSDIRSFTRMTEKLPPNRLTKILQEYFDAMTEEVMATEGVVDKFIGDGIMAFWGAPIKQPDHADRAIATACRMIKRLDKLKARWKAEGLEGLEMGIGIHLGVATIGNMGSKLRSNYTAIGDVVNVASRLEGLNKKYDSHIIISESARQHLMKPIRTRDLGRVDLVGRDEQVHVHEVLLD
jgi:class 3 adenylate cyclase